MADKRVLHSYDEADERDINELAGAVSVMIAQCNSHRDMAMWLLSRFSMMKSVPYLRGVIDWNDGKV